ncbi:MAG: HK97 family phage prohead protease, partial [Pseudohongiellaceae bacterium]
MQQKHVTAALDLKSLDEGGYFEGYASVFGVQDSDGDVIVKGAFANSIAKAVETGRMPKMLWQHDHRQIIGKWLEMREDDNGLWVKGRLIMDV